MPVFVWRAYPEAPRRAAFFEETLGPGERGPGGSRRRAAASIIPFGEIMTDPRTASDDRRTPDRRRRAAHYRVERSDAPATFGRWASGSSRAGVFGPLGLADNRAGRESSTRPWLVDSGPMIAPLAARIRLTDGPDVVREIIGNRSGHERHRVGRHAGAHGVPASSATPDRCDDLCRESWRGSGKHRQRGQGRGVVGQPPNCRFDRS